MTLPAFAAERRRLLYGDRAVDRYILPIRCLAANPVVAIAAVD